MNKEYGSDFHLLTDETLRTYGPGSTFWDRITPFFSGRSALRAILQFGIEKFQWNRLYIPDYYCHEVYRYLEDLPIQFIYYQVHPLEGSVALDIEDVATAAVLKVNYFGWDFDLSVQTTKCSVIEDITHNLSLLHRSKADFVFGSLRKELPLPVGGFVKRLNMPDYSVSAKAEDVALRKFRGMALKRDYLEGKFAEKQVFRDLLTTAESNFEDRSTHGSMPSSVAKYAHTLDVESIKLKKIRNSQLIKSLLNPSINFRLIVHERHEELALIFTFANRNNRDLFKSHLVANTIYPMVLWPGQKSDAAKLVEETILMIHIDFRYSEADIKHISTIINNFNIHV